jgi:prepilin-type N-terminal cleavage/methylation domain
LNRGSARAEQGFTVLEAIVTLVIFAMLVTLLMQSLQQALRVRERVFRHQQATRVDELQSVWFRDSINAAIAAPLGEGEGFEGGPDHMRLLTQASLDGIGMQPIEWSLRRREGGDALHYAGSGWSDVVALEGPLQAAVFSYMNAKGEWQQHWRPGPDDRARLPLAVKLEGIGPDGPLLWMAAIPVQKSPKTLKLPPELPM